MGRIGLINYIRVNSCVFGTPRGVYISAGENPARPIDCSGGSERNSNVPREGVDREVYVRVPR